MRGQRRRQETVPTQWVRKRLEQGWPGAVSGGEMSAARAAAKWAAAGAALTIRRLGDDKRSRRRRDWR